MTTVLRNVPLISNSIVHKQVHPTSRLSHKSILHGRNHKNLLSQSSKTLLVVPKASSDAEPTSTDARPFTVIMECDGGLIDVQNDGHRVAFNKAFEEIGYTCVTWSPGIYNDLVAHGDGTAQGLVKTYYKLVGWPLMLPSKERPSFVENVVERKNRVFSEMVAQGQIPLRPGALEFIDELLDDGVKPVVLAGTGSAAEDSVVSSAMYNLGPGRSRSIQVITLGRPESEEAEDDPNFDDSMAANGLSLEQQLKTAKEEARATAAASFVKAYNLQKTGLGMAMDPALLAAAERSRLLSPQYLVAIISAMGGSTARSALVSGHHSIMQAGKGAGLYVAAVPPSFSGKGGYTAADGRFDGFGAGCLTWRKLKAILENRK